MIIHREGCDGIRCNCDKKPETLKEYLEQEEEKEESEEKPIDWWGLA
jgi:hypothetical protein